MGVTDGNAAQTRAIAEQVADATISRFAATHPELKPPEIHPLVKWLVGAIAAFGSAAIIGLGFWLVNSVSTMQVTLARMDERMAGGSIKDGRVDDLDRRVTTLEGYHKGNGQ